MSGPNALPANQDFSVDKMQYHNRTSNAFKALTGYRYRKLSCVFSGHFFVNTTDALRKN
jgi:hypothetical protein